MSVQVKICGVTTAAALDAAIVHRASHVGFNFYPPSPRWLAPAKAAPLAAQADGRLVRVGVFVDPDDALLAEAIAAASLDAVQLHKVEAGRRAAIRAHFGLPLWAVVPVRSAADLAVSRSIDAATADLILYDAATPAGAALPGGMGVRIDWALLANHRHALPWGLAGGLDAANVAEAIRITGAPLVDVASGVESAAGVKDVDKIAAFLRAAQR